MGISAADVKRLREETDAPMMDCKRALTEANGDFDKAKQILREAGTAAAAKKSGRATKEGIAKMVASEDGKSVAGVVVECETDFVSGNDDFKSMVNSIVKGFLSAKSATDQTEINGTPVATVIQDAVGKIRENIQIREMFFESTSEGQYAVYNHHDGKWASYVVYTGDNAETAKHAAIQVVAFKPTFLTKDEVPADIIEKEIATETARAVKEGKPENIAENIAKGRVNKEFFQQQVLLEQPIYNEPKSKVGDYMKANGNVELKSYRLLQVGGGSDESEGENE